MAKIHGALGPLLCHAALDEAGSMPLASKNAGQKIVPAISKILIEFLDEQNESVLEFSAKAPVSGEMIHLNLPVGNILQELMVSQTVFLAEG